MEEPLGGEYGLYGQYVYGDDLPVDEDYFDEQWKVCDENNLYYVSTHGRIWSAASQKFIKPKRLDNHGHVGVSLSYGGKNKYRYLHRLMAKAFMPNPDNLPVVRHLDDDPKNNFLYNLEWGTQKDNHQDCVDNGNYRPFTDEDREKAHEKQRTPITAIDISSGKRMHFKGQGEAARKLGLQQSNIFKVLRGERKHTGGYTFELDGDRRNG